MLGISKLLIANRGEIAVRILRAARDLGIKTVQVYSQADADSLPVQMADEVVEIGPPAARKSYLDAKVIIDAAKKTGADAIHPGYGFLSENASFSEAVKDAGLVFVGPSADVIRRMGDKSAARATAKMAGVPTVPGSDGILDDTGKASEIARKIGYPVMIKASAGGGGRGIRVANSEKEIAALISQASTEAKAAFGDGNVYIEKVIKNPRHIEVQLLGDGKNYIHCYERECSLQRRRQKVWEEAPSTALTIKTREAMCASAVAIAAAVKYRGAGTIEYLYDDESEQFYFIEMNTRIQVEHPISEYITGIDIMTEMIRLAAGESLSYSQGDVSMSGHAIEVRINAEDPTKNFMPFPGIVGKLVVPGGPGVRFDHFLYPGYQIPPFYDSLLGKLIVHAETRDKALSRLKGALTELHIGDVKTTAPLFLALANSSDLIAGNVHTGWLESWFELHSKLIVT